MSELSIMTNTKKPITLNKVMVVVGLLSVVFVVIVGGGYQVIGCRVYQDWQSLSHHPSRTNQQILNASLEVLKAFSGAVATVATIGTGLVLFFNFRETKRNVDVAVSNLKLAESRLEQEAEKIRKDMVLSEARLITDRFAKAIDLLGSEKPDVCLGAIYALERIAKDSPQDHWTIMEVLIAYVKRSCPLSVQPEDSEVPKTLTIEVQAALTVIGMRTVESDRKEGVIDLRYTNLQGANLETANLQKANFRGAKLQKANLRNANLQFAELPEASLVEAFLSKANLSNAILSGANLNGATLVKTDLSGAVLINADLSGANLCAARLVRCDMRVTMLSGANFEGADLSNARITRSDLSDASFLSANLSGANLSIANLSGTDLSNANLSGARLNDTTAFDPEQLSRAKLCQTIFPPDIPIDPNRDCEELGLPRKTETPS